MSAIHDGTFDLDDAGFDHIVITRFSAVFDATHDPMPREWVEYRLGFFYDATCASMAAQTGCAPFTWLVFFDERIDEDLRREIDESAADGLFVPVWTHDVFWDVLPGIVDKYASGQRFLLTTRIDSGDAVAKDYMAAIQTQFDGQVGLTYNFPSGLQVVSTGEVYRYDEPTGPFQTYVEERTDARLPRTVFGVRLHARARAIGPLREIQGPPMWLQVIHGGNIANAVRGIRTSPQALNERFAIDLPYRREVSRGALAVGIVVSHWSAWDCGAGSRTTPSRR